ARLGGGRRDRGVRQLADDGAARARSGRMAAMVARADRARQRSDRGRGRARPGAGARRGRAGVLRLRRLSRALHRDAAMRKSEEATMTGIDDETSPTLRRAGIELVLAPRARDLGGFTVRRALPAAQRRMVGPFIFWDQ